MTQSIASTFYRRTGKRLLDIIASFLAMIVLSPIILIVAILVRWKLDSPVLFSQERPGLNEKPFPLIKFRTMTDERDEKGQLLPDSVRLTRFGKFLRSTSLDELPELWTIFIGDMSFVGPRPLLMQYLPLYSDEQRLRHSVRPGLSGLAQVNGRNAIDWPKKFALDIEYVENCSLWLDMAIAFHTLKAIFARSGINAEGEATMKPFAGNSAAEAENQTTKKEEK